MTASTSQDGSQDGSAYYGYARPEMLEFIPKDTRRLLDIGCGAGRFAEAVKAAMPECETWGVEPFPPAAAQAALRIDKVFNVEIGAADALPHGYFDVITMNDVLEHIDYSEPVLALVKRLLRPGGVLVLSLPNVRYFLNMRDLIFRKDWKYADEGVLDRTHLRFFTQKSAVRLLEENGFEISRVKGIGRSKLKLHYQALFSMAPKFFDDMRYLQFAIVSRPVA